jgi:polar amino acid transport system substrate-binding protein
MVLAGCQKKTLTGLERIKQKGTLVLATESTYPPFQYFIVENGKTINAGLDIDILKAFTQSIGVQFMTNEMAFDSIIPAVQAGTADIGGTFTPTEERALVIDFTANYYHSEHNIIIRKGEYNLYPTAESFLGKRLGAQKGSVQENVIKEIGIQDGLSLPKVTALIQELVNRNIDGIVMDFSVADTYGAAYPDLIEKSAVSIPGANNGIAFVVAKGQEDLVAELDKFINKSISDGTVDRLYDKNIKAAIDQILEATEE